jgi:hypothetical protein
MLDSIDHPQHYTAHSSGIEAIQICEHLDFCLGNAIKYLWRAGKKANTVEDLKKSAWYLRRALGEKHHILGGEYFPIAKVIESEPIGSVLRDVLELVVVKMLIGDQPRIADALARVERETGE